MDYLAYLETLWEYLPYIIYTFVILTFVPKSLRKIKTFADADYERNRLKYHRCYSPDICCHTLHDDEPQTKPAKQRRAVTRVYPKRNSVLERSTEKLQESAATIRRQVQPSSIQTHTHVNQIAKMFENGHANRKINRVTPTILPEIRVPAYDDRDEEREEISPKKHSRLSQLMSQLENNENSANILNQADGLESENTHKHNGISTSINNNNSNWRSEPIALPRRRNRATPSILTFAGTSTTPSTASPVASSPQSSPLSSPMDSPVLRQAPLLLSIKSSLEDIFAAIARSAESSEGFMYSDCNTLSPVTSIDDILSQRRLSRPLSAYSISDLLNEENATSAVNEPFVENYLRTLNKT